MHMDELQWSTFKKLLLDNAPDLRKYFGHFLFQLYYAIQDVLGTVFAFLGLYTHFQSHTFTIVITAVITLILGFLGVIFLICYSYMGRTSVTLLNRLLNRLLRWLSMRFLKACTALDVVIVTAVEVEHKAVKKVLQRAGCEEIKPFQIRKRSGEVVVGGSATSLQLVDKNTKKSSTYKVGLFQLLEMGETGASNSLKAIEYGIESNQVSRSCFLVMVGMCAGNPQRVCVGDIMTPHKITKRSGKQGPRRLQPEVIIASISHDVRIAVQAASPDNYGYEWISKYLPDDVRHTPSPRYLQDTILHLLKKASGGMSSTQLHKQIAETKKDWPTQSIISKQVVEEALDILKSTRRLVTKTNNKFKISQKKNSRSLGFPKSDPRYPKIQNNPIIAGDLVRVGMTVDDWKKLAVDVGQRKAGGYEMEGYGFLNYAESFLETTHRWFVKVVTDYATGESKMDYYQEYGACLATAFLLHVLEVNPTLAERE